MTRSNTDRQGQDLDAPLGDAEEVYDIEVAAEHGFTINGSSFSVQEDHRDDARLRVDEIQFGKVHLATWARESDPEYSSLTTLKPEKAQALGYALLRAADYADDQEGAQ